MWLVFVITMMNPERDNPVNGNFRNRFRFSLIKSVTGSTCMHGRLRVLVAQIGVKKLF